MKKTIYTLAAVMMIIALVFTGCGKAENTQSSSGPADTDGIAAPSETKNSQPVTLRITTSKNSQGLDPKDMLVNKTLFEKTGITIAWNAIAGESYSEKKNLMLASNDLPDVFMDGISRDDVMKYSGQGIFIPLETLQEQNCPNLGEIYSSRPDYKKAMYAPDGHIYGFPVIEEMNGLVLNQGILEINKVWLDKLGLPVPKTLDEFKNTLIAFRDKDPNGNNKKDEIPFSYIHQTSGLGAWRNGFEIGQFMGCFGDADRGDNLNIKDGKIYCTATTDAYKAGINYFHQMYSEKLIDPDFASQKLAALEAKLNAEVPVLGSFVGFSISDYTDKDRRAMYVSVPYLQGPNGEYGCRDNNAELFSVTNFVVTKACKNPEAAVRWADACFDPELSVQCNWGALNYVYKKNDQGVMVFDTLKDGLDNFSQMRFRNSLVTYPRAVLSDYYDKVVEYPQDAQYLYNDMKNIGFVDKHLKDPSVPTTLFWFSKEQSERIAQISPLVYGEIDKRRAAWVIDGGIDKDWDTYVNTLKKNGLDEIISIVQKNTDEMNSPR